MATRIRLKRLGRRNRPFYRIIVIDSRKRRDGAAIEEVGWYDPILKNDKNFKLKDERILHWLSLGAQPSDVVKNMMKKSGLSHKWHLIKQGLNAEDIEKNMQKWQLDRNLIISRRIEKSQEKAKVEKKKNEDDKEVEEKAKDTLEVDITVEEVQEDKDEEAKTEASEEDSAEEDTEDAQEETDTVEDEEAKTEASEEDKVDKNEKIEVPGEGKKKKSSEEK